MGRDVNEPGEGRGGWPDMTIEAPSPAAAQGIVHTRLERMERGFDAAHFLSLIATAEFFSLVFAYIYVAYIVLFRGGGVHGPLVIIGQVIACHDRACGRVDHVPRANASCISSGRTFCSGVRHQLFTVPVAGQRAQLHDGADRGFVARGIVVLRLACRGSVRIRPRRLAGFAAIRSRSAGRAGESAGRGGRISAAAVRHSGHLRLAEAGTAAHFRPDVSVRHCRLLSSDAGLVEFAFYIPAGCRTHVERRDRMLFDRADAAGLPQGSDDSEF